MRDIFGVAFTFVASCLFFALFIWQKMYALSYAFAWLIGVVTMAFIVVVQRETHHD